MKIRIKKTPLKIELNASHWKHLNGGHLFLEDGQIFRRPLDDLTGRNILTSPILPPKSWYEQFTIPELEPKKPQPLQPIEGTYGNKYSELVPMSDETYINNTINKGLQLDWRTHALEFAPFLAIGAGPAIGSTATWLASKPALYNLGRMTLSSEIGGRSVDLASNLFTGNTWGLNVSNVVEGTTGWNPNNTMVGLFITDLTNPGYAGKEGLASLAGLFTRFGKRKPKLSAIPEYVTNNNYSTWTDDMWTAAQDAAIARGDMAEALRLRDLHFKVKTPDNKITTDWRPYPEETGLPLKLYHGTYNDFNSFDYSHFGETDEGFYGRGWYLTRNKPYAETYGDKLMELYAYGTNPLDVGDAYRTTRNYKASQYFGKDLSKTNAKEDIVDILKDKDFVNVWVTRNTSDLTPSYYPFEEVVIKNPNNVKSSKAVTYDDKGVRIPLGLRDNFKINDIRYGLIPLGGIGLYGLQNRVNKQYN